MLTESGVGTGLGSYGENGLLVIKEFGSAILISGLLILAALDTDTASREIICDHCMCCVETCPRPDHPELKVRVRPGISFWHLPDGFPGGCLPGAGSPS